jgi:hypothetical protein
MSMNVIRETAPIANMSTSLHINVGNTGQCLSEGQTPNNGRSLRLLGGTRMLTFPSNNNNNNGEVLPVLN